MNDDDMTQMFATLVVLTVIGAGIVAIWQRHLQPVADATFKAARNGDWNAPVGSLPGMGEVTAVTALGVAVAAFIAVGMVVRLVAWAVAHERGEE